METQLPSPSPTQFSAHICCGQMAAWIKVSLGMELDLGPGDFLLDGDPAPPPPLSKWGSGAPPRGSVAPQIFDPCSLWLNGWVDEANTWHGGRPQPRRLCVRWGPSSPPKTGGRAPQFSAHFYCGQTAGCMSCHLVWR